MTMNICIECRVLNHHHRTGVMTYTEGLVNGLHQNDRTNQYFLNYFALRMNASQMPGPEGPNFKKVIFPVPDREFVFKQELIDRVVLPAFLKKNKIRVFHRPDGHTIPDVKDVFKVLTIHDLRTLTIGDNAYQQNIEGYRRTINSLDACTVVSECTKKDLLKHFKIDERKVWVTYLAADERFRRMDPAPIEAVKTKYDLHEPFLLAMGLTQRKNLEGIIRAFAKSRHARDHILILATYVDIERYKAIAESLGVGGRMRVLSRLTDDEVVALYNGCRAFVFPSLYEGFGLPILEAMQCGAPVITSNTSSCPEVAGDAAILVDPKNLEEIADAINEICENDSQRQELIRRGSQRCQLFSWANFTQEMKKVYLTAK
jgi:glycosyltransferase involved in cell wall biosynthesis